MISSPRLNDTRLLARGVLAIGILAAGLTGCGSPSGASGSGPTAVSSAPVSSGASTAASPSAVASSEAVAPGASPHAIDVCATLPAATAAKLSGEAITTATAQTNLQPQEYGCAYANDDDSLQVEVTVYEDNTANSYDEFLAATKNASMVTGLGDKAFFDNQATMYVLAGSTLIQVNGLKTADESAALARPVLAAL